MMGDDGAGFEAAGYLKEYARGNTGDDEVDVHVHAGLVSDPTVRKWLTWMAERYYPATDEMPATFWETKFARRTLRKHGTETAQRAVENGQMHVIDFLTGMPGARADISAIDTIDWLQNWVTRDAPVTVITGHMNSGKTNNAFLFSEIWRRQTGGVVMANIRSCPETVSVTSMDRLVELVMNNPDDPKLFIFDEAASHASSDLNDHEVKEQMRQLIRFLAKLNCGLIVIGHADGGKDLNTEFRRFAHAVDKTGKKTATIYEEVTEGREYDTVLKELTGIPPTSWDYDPDEPSTWEWDYEGDDLVDRINDDADYGGYEDALPDDWTEDDHDGDEGATDEDEEKNICGAPTDSGEPCQRKIPGDAERCYDHRD